MPTKCAHQGRAHLRGAHFLLSTFQISALFIAMNYTLAIEASTATPTVALLHNDAHLGNASWLSTRGASQRMFEAIHSLLKSHNISLDSVDLFGVGLGPGGFTGLRLALSAIRAMALPTHTPIIGISSAEAIAMRLQLKGNIAGQRILVIGDARRKRLWVGIFEVHKNAPRQTGTFELIPIDEFAHHLKLGDTIVSPDHERLGDDLQAVIPPSATLIEGDQVPTATDIALLARTRKTLDTPGEPLNPIYMHPPVFVKPRFTPPVV